jgi:hypothetical protein
LAIIHLYHVGPSFHKHLDDLLHVLEAIEKRTLVEYAMIDRNVKALSGRVKQAIEPRFFSIKQTGDSCKNS